MRHHAHRFILLVVLALFVGSVASSSLALADVRSDAKAHYQAGVKAYGAADYRTAIKEFSAAQQLMPADLNNYNLALCYDKLGEAEPAIQYYKEYLAKVPNADKRTEIEASISRLEGALKSASAKRAEEARKAEEVRKTEEEMRRAEEARKKQGATTEPPKGGGVGVSGDAGTGATDPNPAVGVGSTGTPGTGQAISTGDAQLDRVSAIDINAVRDQRAGMGTNDQSRGGPQNVGAGGGAGAGANPQANNQPPNNGRPANEATAPTDQQPKKPTPVYKKWWFWAVVAVSAFVVYQIVSTDSEPGNATRSREMFGQPIPGSQAPGGMTLLRW